MAHSYPIWIDVSDDSYKSNKSFGFKDVGIQTVYAGKSAKDSYHFATIRLRKNGDNFDLVVDGKTIKTGKVENGELKVKTKLNRIKSL